MSAALNHSMPPLLPRLRAAGADAVVREGRLIMSGASLVPAALMDEARARRDDLVREVQADDAFGDAVEAAAIAVQDVPVERRRKRMVSWADPADVPQPGDFCGCCSGSLWWTRASVADGWCCCACHPATHLVPGQYVVRAT